MRQTRDWENQYITQKNRLSDAYAIRGAYETVKQALAGNRNASLCSGSERRLEIQNVSVTETVMTFYEISIRSMGCDSRLSSTGNCRDMEAGFTQYAVSVQAGGKRRSI